MDLIFCFFIVSIVFDILSHGTIDVTVKIMSGGTNEQNNYMRYLRKDL